MLFSFNSLGSILAFYLFQNGFFYSYKHLFEVCIHIWGVFVVIFPSSCQAQLALSWSSLQWNKKNLCQIHEYQIWYSFCSQKINLISLQLDPDESDAFDFDWTFLIEIFLNKILIIESKVRAFKSPPIDSISLETFILLLLASLITLNIHPKSKSFSSITYWFGGGETFCCWLIC